MKTLIVLTCVALAVSWPVERRRGGGGGGGGGKGNGGQGGTAMPEMPEGPIEPLKASDLLELMANVKSFAAEARGHFDKLADEAKDMKLNEEDLNELGEKTMKMVEELEEMGGERSEKLGTEWMAKMIRLAVAGVEGEGQCHHVLELLRGYLHETEEKRQMEADELEFWGKVVEAAGKEVGCIIGRFHKFEGMLTWVEDAINNEEADDEDGGPFEAEVLMGGVLFGFSHMYRQVAFFTAVMRGLAESEEQSNAGARTMNKLRSLLSEAEKLQDRMDKMRSLRKFGHKALF